MRFNYSYNGRLIGTHMWSIEWCHFQWSWVNLNLDFKVTKFWMSNNSKMVWAIVTITHSLTHCCAWPARAVAISTTSHTAPMTTASRLCTRDPLPPIVSRSSLADQVDASSRGQGICPARGWHSAGRYCGLACLVVDSKHVLSMSVFCWLWWLMRGRSVSFVGSERNHWWRSRTTFCSGCAVVPSCEKPAVGPCRLWSESTFQIHAARWIEQGTCRVSVSYSDWVSCFSILRPTGLLWN